MNLVNKKRPQCGKSDHLNKLVQSKFMRFVATATSSKDKNLS